MNAQTKVKAASDNMTVWNALSKSDPKQTKGFSRAGGFKGTALKPIWIVKRLTEQFGPCGTGWGVGKPEFEVVPGNGEMLVFCTVSCWHGTPENVLHGVGGDKVVGKNKNGLFCDDEAFKKAFTDAIGNAFKFIGIGADIHMGLFEDSKYLAELQDEFAERITDDKVTLLQGYAEGGVINAQRFCKFFGIEKFEQLPADRWEEAEAMVEAKRAKIEPTPEPEPVK